MCLNNLLESGDPEEASSDISPTFFLGVVISLISSAVTNLGANVQKWALNKECRRPAHERRPMYKIPIWVAGFVLFVSAQAGDALALRFAPQSVVQPVGAVSLLANLFFGWWLNNEPLGKLTPIALMVIILGVGLIVIFGPKGTTEWDVEHIENRWHDADVVTYAGVIGGCTLGLVLLLRHYDKRITANINRQAKIAQAKADRAAAAAAKAAAVVPHEDRPASPVAPSVSPSHDAKPIESPPPSPPPLASDDNAAASPSAVVINGVRAAVVSSPREEQRPPQTAAADDDADGEGSDDLLSCLSAREKSFVRLLYPFTASMCAGWSPLLMKQTLLLLSSAFDGQARLVFTSAATYFIVLGTCCSGPLQLTWLAKGLRYVEAQLIVPTFASCFTIFSILGGAVFFKEFDSFCPSRIALFALSAMITIFGVFLLYQRVPGEGAAAATAAATNATATDDAGPAALGKLGSSVVDSNAVSPVGGGGEPVDRSIMLLRQNTSYIAATDLINQAWMTSQFFTSRRDMAAAATPNERRRRLQRAATSRQQVVELHWRAAAEEALRRQQAAASSRRGSGLASPRASRSSSLLSSGRRSNTDPTSSGEGGGGGGGGGAGADAGGACAVSVELLTPPSPAPSLCGSNKC